MGEKTYKFFDIIIKILGFAATALSIYLGLDNFNKQQTATLELEFKRSSWKRQTEIYSEVCKNAGALVANSSNPKVFEEQKKTFLTFYYGEMVLVEDIAVDSSMRELKSYVDIVDASDPKMILMLSKKVIQLSIACKKSLENYKKLME